MKWFFGLMQPFFLLLSLTDLFACGTVNINWMDKIESVEKYIILFNKNNKTFQVTVEYLTFLMNWSSSSPSSSMIKCSCGRRTCSNTGRNPLLFWKWNYIYKFFEGQNTCNSKMDNFFRGFPVDTMFRGNKHIMNYFDVT